MKQLIKDITLMADYQENEPVDYENLSSDVIVTFDNGDQYVATFHSYRSLEALIEELNNLREGLNGQFYKILDMVLVKDFNHGDLRPIIESMVAEGDFQLIFKKV